MSDATDLSDAGHRNEDPHRAAEFGRPKRNTLIFLLAYVAALVHLLPEGDQLLEFLVSLPILIGAVHWSFLDAQERDFALGKFLRLSIVLIFVIGFPIYIFRTRGIHGIKTLLLSALFSLAMIGCALMTEAVFLSLFY